MRGTVVRRALSMRCTIERDVVTGTDPFGQPIVTPTIIATNVPCFFWEGTGVAPERLVEGPNVIAIVTSARVEMEARTDIKAGDRILDVVASDVFVMAVKLKVNGVVQRGTVTVADVEEIT